MRDKCNRCDNVRRHNQELEAKLKIAVEALGNIKTHIQIGNNIPKLSTTWHIANSALNNIATAVHAGGFSRNRYARRFYVCRQKRLDYSRLKRRNLSM